MKPLVSILIPAYNAEPFLAQTIRSAQAQAATWPRTEVIVLVDEGSRDKTMAVARRLASKTVSVVARPHQNAAAARNAAYSLCQGDYVQWLDADDLLAPDKVALQMQLAERLANKRMLLSAAWAYFFYRPSKANFRPNTLWADLTPEQWLIHKMADNDFMQPATWLISRELAEAAGPWDPKVVCDEDGEYFNRLVLQSEGIRFCRESKVYYRVSAGASFTSRSLFDAEGRWASIQMQLALLRSRGDSERIRAAGVRYLQHWLVFFYPEHTQIIAEAQRLAAEMGGHLEMPKLRWKYVGIEKLFGYATAKRAQLLMPRFKNRLIMRWDKFMFEREQPKTGQLPAVSFAA
jgi:glycosyltransferase involved in cell wall biosynthesis